MWKDSGTPAVLDGVGMQAPSTLEGPRRIGHYFRHSGALVVSASVGGAKESFHPPTMYRAWPSAAAFHEFHSIAQPEEQAIPPTLWHKALGRLGIK